MFETSGQNSGGATGLVGLCNNEPSQKQSSGVTIMHGLRWLNILSSSSTVVEPKSFL